MSAPELTVLFRVITRRDWARLWGWHAACPGAHVEHLMHNLYALHLPARVTPANAEGSGTA